MRKLLFLMLGMLLIQLQLLAQDRVVTGKVTDANKAPVPGATVRLKNSGVGTSTATDGSFSLTVPANETTLVVSAVNLNTQEITIGDRTSISVSMEAANQTLEQVVVVGYGTQRRASTTGSINTIRGKAFDQVPVASF